MRDKSRELVSGQSGIGIAWRAGVIAAGMMKSRSTDEVSKRMNR